MNPTRKFVFLLVFILVLLAPQLIFMYKHASRQPIDPVVLSQTVQSPASDPGLGIVNGPELIKIPAPSDKPVSISILMYHEIGEGPDCMWVSAQDFYNQMKYLHDNRYQTITLSQAVELLKGHYDTGKMVVLTFDDGYDTFYTNAWPVLREFNQRASLFIISDLVGQPGYMSWEQINTLASNGVEIGGHTRTHPFLTNLDSSQAGMEIMGGKQDIESKLGLKITMFCYPTGKYNPEVIKEVTTAGYNAAVTMVQGRASSTDNVLLLPRLGVYKDDPLDRFTEIVK